MRPALMSRRVRYGLPGRFTSGAILSAVPGTAFAAGAESTIEPLITLGALALALAAGLWALAQIRVVRLLRRKLREAGGAARAAIGARDALIAAGRDPLVAWGGEEAPSRNYGDAEAIVESCLAGVDAITLAEALDALADRGAPFLLNVRDEQGRAVTLRGRAVGGMAAVWVETNNAAGQTDFRAILDVIPVPVWLRNESRALAWGNRAFLSAAGQSDVESAVAAQAALEKSDRDLASAARSEGHVVESKRFAIIGGQRRALVLTHIPLGDGGIVGTATDVTELSNVEAMLQQHIDAHADTLDKLATAVAIFDRGQRLSFFNDAFVRLWNLPDSWLDLHPTDEEILDRLRETRKLPEQRDYQAWKRQRLAFYEQALDYTPEDLWYLPGGKTLRVIAQPHPFGGLTYLYEDVTEKLALESSYNTLIKVQSATLDTLSEGVAVFGPDARLKLHNAAFARMWKLEPAALAGEPHVQKIAEACIGRSGDAPIWQNLAVSIASGTEHSRNWDHVERADGTVLTLAIAPLPDGAILVTFADVTDRFRIESALRDRAEALEAADRLKSDFVHHASFLFRDPLNAVHGFASLLAAGQAGPLAPKQAEYVDAILTASNNLADVTSDILDLALIDSGTMRLELGQVNLHDLLSRAADTLQKHADSLGVALRRDWNPQMGWIIADGRRIRQIIFNLLSNAFKFTPPGGGITLSAAVVDDEVQIAVADSGPGIAPDVKANVFDRFAAKGRTGQPAGAGLGLALVKRFIELHDGWVEIETTPDRGTTVRCHLPRRMQITTAKAG
ncbi:MAG TPA: PAS-domain containing protein [Rhizomicrobium sp.]|nr:PAS-domain containing protein [Rhizomicrobium sp.]